MLRNTKKRTPNGCVFDGITRPRSQGEETDCAFDGGNFRFGLGADGCADVEHRIGILAARAVGEIFDIDAFRRDERGDLREHIGNVAVHQADALCARARHGNGRVIDRIDDIAVFKEVGKLATRHLGTVVLRLISRGAEVRNIDDAGIADRFVGREVGDISGDLARSERLLHILGVDEVGARKIDDADAVLHHIQRLFADHPLGFGGGGDMERDIVGFTVDLIVGCGLVHRAGERPRGGNRDIGVATEHGHTQTAGGVCHHTADGAETDYTERFAVKFTADIGGLALLDRFGNSLCAFQRIDPLDAADDVARGEDQGGDGEFFDAVCVGARGVKDDHARFGATVDGNIVDTRTRTRDGAQGRRDLHFEK